MLRGNLTKNKSFFPCGIWSCRPNSVKSTVTLRIFTESHMAMPGRCSSKSSDNCECESCLLPLFPGMFHSVTAHHIWVVGERTMLTLGICLFLWGCSDATVSAISPSTGPLATDDQSSKNSREISSLLDLREADEKRHDAGKCHICVTDWSPAARIHYSVPNRPPDITLSWTLLKRSAIHAFPTAGGKICCHSPGVRGRKTHPWVPTQPMEMLCRTSNVSTFFSMENSLLWTCVYIDKGVLIQALKISWSPTLLGSLCQWTIWKQTGSFLPNILLLLKYLMLTRRQQKQIHQLTSSQFYFTSSRRIGERTRAEAVPWAALPWALHLQVQMEKDTIISCPVHSLTSHQAGRKDTGTFWSGSALLVPLNCLSARICFGGNGKENWIRLF